MRPIWKGTLSFSMVTIPVALYPAVRHSELNFRLLRRSDLSPVDYQRVAEADGKRVPWEEIVKGYEYESGRFVVLSDQDFRRVDLEAAAETVTILDFVREAEIDPIYFEKPHYLEPQKGGEHAYCLLREALRDSEKIGIAKVIIRTREHLACVKTRGKALILELLHFRDELVDCDELSLPGKERLRPRELEMAQKLIEGMTSRWNPEKYKDEYRSQLRAMIEEKIRHPAAKPKRAAGSRPSPKAADLMGVLEESLARARRHPPGGEPRRIRGRGRSA